MSTDDKAAELIRDGYMQISARYRRVARLPLGKTGLEALRRANPELARSMEENLERAATDQYLRCHATDVQDLDEETFIDFKRLGGTTPW